MQLFARITKVDEASRTVEGVIADETPDKSGERFDYASSKPHFEKWSTDIAKATDGKSLGNVRVMHGNTVAGVTKELNFDDVAKAIAVKAYIADDNEWNKVQAGCYTGFSIGGRYGKKWEDGSFKRYEAIPNEYSLVDLPCNPSAQFTVVKADGTEELRKFEKVAERKDANPTGGVKEFDALLQDRFDNYRLIPDRITISGGDQAAIKNLILAGNTNLAPFIDAQGNIRAGGRVQAYRNPIGYGPSEIPIRVHPFLPQGTVLFHTSQVPYALSNVRQIMKMNLRRDYYSILWPLRSRKYEYGVYFDGVLQHYFPASMGIISNIAAS